MKRFRVILNAKCIKDFNTFGGAFNFFSGKMLEMNEGSELLLYDSNEGKVVYEVCKN